MSTSKYLSKDNPYTLQFSYIPPQYISRKRVTDEITDDLRKAVPAFRCHFITGVRGSGKTVMMAEISRIIDGLEDWIVVDIENPESNILDSLARGLYRNPQLRSMFIKAKLDVSVLGLGISLESPDAIASNEADAIDYMLKILKDMGKRVLVAIDEVTYCKEIAAFSHSLSSYARSGYEIYVLMTGLKENINSIKNDRSLTFLYRAKEHMLESLNTTAIITNYSKVFSLARDLAEQMAWMTKGYSFAFQVLGYLYWESLCKNEHSNPQDEEIISTYDQYLAEFSYDKIWSELAPKERIVMHGIAICPSSEVKQIRNLLSMESSEFSVYRSRLLEKGLINGNNYGHISFTLPRFGEYARLQATEL